MKKLKIVLLLAISVFIIGGCSKKEEPVELIEVDEVTVVEEKKDEPEDKGRGERVIVNQAQSNQDYESRDTQTQGGGSSVSISNGSIVQPVANSSDDDEESVDSIVDVELDVDDEEDLLFASRENEDGETDLTIIYYSDIETEYEVTEEVLNDALNSEEMQDKSGTWSVLFFDKYAVLTLGYIDTDDTDEGDKGAIITVDLSVG